MLIYPIFTIDLTIYASERSEESQLSPADFLRKYGIRGPNFPLLPGVIKGESLGEEAICAAFMMPGTGLFMRSGNSVNRCPGTPWSVSAEIAIKDG
jgi:hypothetical protein